MFYFFYYFEDINKYSGEFFLTYVLDKSFSSPSEQGSIIFIGSLKHLVVVLLYLRRWSIILPKITSQYWQRLRTHVSYTFDLGVLPKGTGHWLFFPYLYGSTSTLSWSKPQKIVQCKLISKLHFYRISF